MVSFEIAVQKNTSVSIRQQLVTQISMQIAAGLLPPGAKLPSIRQLSARLGIHYNTCLAAYNELAEIGLIAIRQGSGVRVAVGLNGGSEADEYPTDGSERQDNLNRILNNMEMTQLARCFVQQVYQRGFDWEEVRALVNQLRQEIETEHPKRMILYVDLHTDILPLFEAELGEGLGMPVQGVGLEGLDTPTLQQYVKLGSHFVTSRYYIGPLKDKLKAAGVKSSEMSRITHVIDVSSGKQQLELIKQLPAGKLITVISHSSSVLQQAEAVITALRGDEVFLRIIPHSEDVPAILDAMDRALLIFADVLLQPILSEKTKKTVYPIRVVPECEIEPLKQMIR